jgi:copper transport protein
VSDPIFASRGRRTARRARAALLAGLLGAFAGLFLASGTVHADNEVIVSDPADGAVLATAPAAIVITFAEDLGEQNTLSLQCNAELMTIPRADVGEDGRTLSVEIDVPLPKGGCIATWAVGDADNEPNGSGNITFTIENEPTVTETTIEGAVPTTTQDAEAAPATPSATTVTIVVLSLDEVETGKGPVWLGRMLSTLGLAVLFGSLITIAAAWPEGVEYLLAIRFIRSAWIIALIGTILYVSAGAAAVNDTGLGSGFRPSAWLDLVDAGWPGRAALVRLVLVVLTAWVAFRPDRVIDPTTQLVALGIPALAVATLGFSRTGGDLPALGMAMGVLHALAMAVWVGGVVLVARVVLAGPGEEDLVHAVRGFSRVSNPAILVTIVTGVVQMVRLDGGSLFSSGHGNVVVLKAVLVAVMIFIAISARQFVNQRMSRANEMSAPLADRLRRAFGAEAAVGIVILAISGWLLALDPPNIDNTPKISYAISRTIEVPEADLDVTIKLTRETVGRAGLEVEVKAPESGLSSMEVIFTAPPDGTIDTITQPVPLTGAGVAVRLESPTGGLPLNDAGDWTVQVVAITPSGLVNSEPVLFTIFTADGAAPTTIITIPPVNTVTIPPTTEE